MIDEGYEYGGGGPEYTVFGLPGGAVDILKPDILGYFWLSALWIDPFSMSRCKIDGSVSLLNWLDHIASILGRLSMKQH